MYDERVSNVCALNIRELSVLLLVITANRFASLSCPFTSKPPVEKCNQKDLKHITAAFWLNKKVEYRLIYLRYRVITV
jgi:hypothetical protein